MRPRPSTVSRKGWHMINSSRRLPWIGTRKMTRMTVKMMQSPRSRGRHRDHLANHQAERLDRCYGELLDSDTFTLTDEAERDVEQS